MTCTTLPSLKSQCFLPEEFVLLLWMAVSSFAKDTVSPSRMATTASPILTLVQAPDAHPPIAFLPHSRCQNSNKGHCSPQPSWNTHHDQGACKNFHLLAFLGKLIGPKGQEGKSENWGPASALPVPTLR